MTEAVIFRSDPAGTEAPVSAQPDAGRPAWLPTQFKTPEDLAKSFAETQAALTRSQQELATIKKAVGGEQQAEPPAAEPPVEEQTSVKDTQEKLEIQDGEQPTPEQIEQATGLDVTPFNAEFNKTGDVSEENRAKIAEALKGLFGEQARAVVDQFVDGSKAQRSNARAADVALVGGEQGWAALQTWASQNLQAGEKAALNEQLQSPNPITRQLALKGLRAQYEAAGNKSPALIQGDNIPTTVGYGSAAEMKADMRDPRYAADPAFREAVKRKASISNF